MTVVLITQLGHTAWDIMDPCDKDAFTERVERRLPDGFRPFTPRYGAVHMAGIQEEDDRLADQALVDLFKSRDPEFRARVASLSRVVGEQVADLVYGKPAHEAAEFLADIREKIAASWPELYQVGTLGRQLDIVEADILHALVVAAVTDSDELRAAARQFVADGGSVPRRKRNRNRGKNRNSNRGRNRTRSRTRKESSNESGNDTAPDKDRPTNGKPRTRKQSGNRNRSRARKGNGKSGNRNQPEPGSAAETGSTKQTGNGNSRNQSANRNRSRNRTRARKGNGNGNGKSGNRNQPEPGSAAETGSTKRTGNGNSRNQSANRNRNAGNSRNRSRNRSRSRNRNGTAPAKGASARS